MLPVHVVDLDALRDHLAAVPPREAARAREASQLAALVAALGAVQQADPASLSLPLSVRGLEDAKLDEEAARLRLLALMVVREDRELYGE